MRPYYLNAVPINYHVSCNELGNDTFSEFLIASCQNMDATEDCDLKQLSHSDRICFKTMLKFL